MNKSCYQKTISRTVLKDWFLKTNPNKALTFIFGLSRLLEKILFIKNIALDQRFLNMSLNKVILF